MFGSDNVIVMVMGILLALGFIIGSYKNSNFDDIFILFWYTKRQRIILKQL